MKIGLKQLLFSGIDRDIYVGQLLKKLVEVMAVLNLIFYVLTLFWGFNTETLFGFLIGFIYVTACYIYVAVTVERAVEMNKKQAKRAMMTCFGIRYAGLFLLCFLAMQFRLFNIIGIVIPQFYPRIAFGIMAFWERKSIGKD